MDALRQGLDERVTLLFSDSTITTRARNEILEHTVSENLIDTSHPIENVITSDIAGPHRFQDKYFKQWPGFRNIVGGTHMMEFFEQFLGGPVLTFNQIWVRATRPGGNSDAHCDGVYMGVGTKHLYTICGQH
jgi:hypothetical protein